MKKLFTILAIAGVVVTAAVMSGCGGSDHNNNIVVPTPSYAPASVTNMTVTLTENGQSRTVNFAPSGTTYTLFDTGTTNAVANGTYQYTQQGNNNAQLILISNDQTGATNQVTYNMAFTSATTGTYTYATVGGATGSGVFSNFVENTGGNNGGNNGGGNGGNNGGNTGGTNTPPASLAGKIIDFTATGSGNERLTFASSGNTVTSDAVSASNNPANYVYTGGAAAGSPSTLVVTFPNGDVYNLTMTFSDNAHGTWSGTQHFDNADHPVPAGSSFTIQNP